MRRVVAYVRRVRAEGFTPAEFKAICLTALVLLGAICVSGAAVRLTGSGLGCDDWPNCNGTTFVDLSNKHAAIEQVNRLFTFLVCIGVALAAVAAWYRRPRRRDLLVLSMVMLLGVPAQGVVGAIVVLADLHPATVQLHFVLSMVLVWAAVLMLVRSGEPDDAPRRAAVRSGTRRRVQVVVVLTGIAVLAGTVATGTGPHAGDEAARRFFGSPSDINGHALQWVTRVHSTLVWLAVASVLALFLHLRKRSADRARLEAPLTAWVVAAVVQGAIGYVQYASGLPAGLVVAHVAGATTLVAVTAWMWAVTS
jgi:cytochrome c oxidase assembly protein subunit 15